MNMRLLKGVVFVAATTGLAILPAATQAKETATDACIRAFVDEQIPDGHPIQVRKREMTGLYYGFQKPSKISVNAKGKRSGKSYGAATCVLDSNGGLVEMYVTGERIRLAQDDGSKKIKGGG
jgi:hypothetical protein